MLKSLRQRLRIDPDLRDKEAAARDFDQKLFHRTDLESESIQRALMLAEQVSQSEQDRETNLNARGAAVATVAGLIVAVSGAVAKSVFAPNDSWTDWTKIVTLALFVAALFAVATSMSIAVVKVLRPKRGARTKNFLGDTLMGLWVHEHEKLLRAGKDRVDLLCLDRAMRTVPEWHIRNRSKSRWLRRSWLFLLIGVVLIAVAGVFMLVHLLGIPEAGGKNGPATKITLWEIFGFLLLLALIAWIAVIRDWPLFAGRRADRKGAQQDKRSQKERVEAAQRAYVDDPEEFREIQEIAEWLPTSLSGEPADRVVADCRRLADGFNCSLTIAGAEADVVRSLAEHAVSVHGCASTPELQQRVRAILRRSADSQDSPVPGSSD